MEKESNENTNRKENLIDVNYVMKLAKLDLSPEDLGHFGAELEKIIGYIDMIGEADVSAVETAEASIELEYDSLAGFEGLSEKFYKDCRIDECKTDESYDFGIVKNNAPDFETQAAGSETGFFLVPQVIE